MSTTMPFASSSPARKATETAKVAPCSACAGPNTAPRNECAIMMWSETSTAYTETSLSRFSRVADELAQHPARRIQDFRQPRRQRGEANGGSGERDQHRGGQQIEGGGAGGRKGAAPAVGGGGAFPPAPHHTQTPAVENRAPPGPEVPPA